MANEPMGPYSVKQADGEWVVRGPSFRGGHLICGDDEEAKEEAADWCFELNKAYAEGRASRDGLREALAIFAKEADEWEPHTSDSVKLQGRLMGWTGAKGHIDQMEETLISVGDLRKAKEALAEEEAR